MTDNKHIVEFYHFNYGDPVPRWVEKVDPEWLQDYSYFETEVIVQRMVDRVLIKPLEPWNRKGAILRIDPPYTINHVHIDGAPTIIDSSPIFNLN